MKNRSLLLQTLQSCVFFSGSEQALLQVEAVSMLEDEIAWLSNFVPSEHQELKETDNCLLAGHLKLIKTLFTCEGVSKEEYGRNIYVLAMFALKLMIFLSGI